jgi:uncharacterized protein
VGCGHDALVTAGVRGGNRPASANHVESADLAGYESGVNLKRMSLRRKPDGAEQAESARNPGQVLGLGNAAIPINFAGLSLTLDRSGAAFIPLHSMLVVSDLHLEKGSGAAARGRLIPALDSHDTLLRLKCAIESYRPKRVVCLGDSFHDGLAGKRMAKADRDALASICGLADEWIWISGNHDLEPPAFCDGERREEFETGGVILRHEPAPVKNTAQIVGHFHPKARVPSGGYRFTGPCYCVSDDLLIMPAFGAYTGGLSCSSPAMRSLHKSEPKIFMLHASKIWRIA